jgi:hypothetical protein
VIDDITATRRRVKVQKEADFYGAMDGASKFVRGDAVAGILITLVNILGGFAVGVFQMGLTLTESLAKFTLLSIGDGLVSQIPALIISIGAGLLVTRAADSNNLGTQITGQLFRYPRALSIGSGFMALFGIMPGMPLIPFWVLAGVGWYSLVRCRRRKPSRLPSRPRQRAASRAPNLGRAPRHLGPREARLLRRPRTCASSRMWMHLRSRLASGSSLWRMRSRGATCWRASLACAKRWRVRKVWSSRLFRCATTLNWRPRSTASSCAEKR